MQETLTCRKLYIAVTFALSFGRLGELVTKVQIAVLNFTLHVCFSKNVNSYGSLAGTVVVYEQTQ